MKTLKNDVMKVLKRTKEIHKDPLVLDYIKKAKTEEEIAMYLFKFYKTDVFAVCFDLDDFPKYWKKWALADYLRMLKHVKGINKDKIKPYFKEVLNTEIVNLFDIDLTIRDRFQDIPEVNEDIQNRLDSRESLHIHMLKDLYEALEDKEDDLINQANEIRKFRMAD